MPSFFSRKNKSRPPPAIRSAESIPNPPAEDLVFHRRFSDARLPVYDPDPQPHRGQPAQQQQQQQQQQPTHGVHRSQSHRHTTHFEDRSSVPASWLSPEELSLAPKPNNNTAIPVHQDANNNSNTKESRKLKKNLPGFLERSLSTTKKPSQRQRHHARTPPPPSLPQSHSTTFLGNVAEINENIDPQMPMNTVSYDPPRSFQQRPPRSPQPSIQPSIQRSNTESSLDRFQQHPSPVDYPLGAPRLESSLSARPPSQQSFGPPSPLPRTPRHHHPDPPQAPFYNQHAMASSERQTGTPQQDTPRTNQSGPYPTIPTDSSFKGSNASQQSIQDTGRSTPTPSTRERREDGELDVRTLLQKHDELQAKYSKVKRYYFEKEAQVQHLQNTVAHQRMAVSRTVLDDNEYANRFNRVDGAIKDLAFSIRKDWKCLPSWLSGYANEDAHQVGTKEMLAIGRAVMSRWVVEEVFHRYFHPALEPNFSMQLKAIEMNLRRQQPKSLTEEDKENAIARISNWRRTTFDGLPDLLLGPGADENRSQLCDHLVTKLVASLEMNLRDPPPPGLDAGARMIVENAVGIADKIPLESRDICIEYFTPGMMVNETSMKIEVGLPPLTNAAAIPGRASVEHDRQEDEGDRDSSSGSTSMDGGSAPSPPGRDQGKKKSVFSSLMGKKQGPTESPRPPSTTTKESKGDEERSIRFASFLSAEVRGKGPMNVLIKAPVYVVE